MDERLAEHYATKYADDATGQAITPLPLYQPAPMDRFTAAVAAVAPRLTPTSDVLELGAGSGVIAASLAARPFRSYTIGDIAQPRLEGLRARLTDDRFRFAMIDAEAASTAV